MGRKALFDSAGSVPLSAPSAEKNPLQLELCVLSFSRGASHALCILLSYVLSVSLSTLSLSCQAGETEQEQRALK